jgi:thymidylate synthase
LSNADIQYQNLVTEIIESGDIHENRTGVNTRRIWGHMAKFDLHSDGFPLLTQKKMAVKTAFVEMLGFCRGETRVQWFEEQGCKIWNADHARWHGKDLAKDKARQAELRAMQLADVTGQVYGAEQVEEALRLFESIPFREHQPNSLGRIYGAQWRAFGSDDENNRPYDQLAEIIKALKAGSNSRRLIMSAWAPNELHMMALPPCHIAYHFVKRGDFVDVAMWQRSCDTALGVPFNWANTALMCHLVGHAANLTPGKMVWFGDDVHIYEPHVEGFTQQFAQKSHEAPRLLIDAPPGTPPWQVNYADLRLSTYLHSEPVKFELFVG